MLPIQLRSQPVRSAKRVVVSAVVALLFRQHRAFVSVTAICSDAQGPWGAVVHTTKSITKNLHAIKKKDPSAVTKIRAALTRALRSVVAFIPVADSQAVIPEEASLEVAEASLLVVRSADVDKL